MAKDKDRIQLGRINFIILIVAALLMIIGYIMLAQNEITISILILAFAYVILVPLGLLYKGKSKE